MASDRRMPDRPDGTPAVSIHVDRTQPHADLFSESVAEEFPQSPASQRAPSFIDVTLAHANMELALNSLCDFIDTYKSFQMIQIISSSIYVEDTWKLGPHRFIMLRLGRVDRDDIWLRLDRRPTSRRGFLNGSGVTPANDKALFGSHPTALYDAQSFRKENELTFLDSATTLGDLGRFLRVVTRELVKYKLWPQNCWMFCSLLQEHLGWGGRGVQCEGPLMHTDLDIKCRIKIKMLVEREYHVPEAFTTQAVLRAFAEDERLRPVLQSDFRAALTLAGQSPSGALNHSSRALVDRLNATAAIFQNSGFRAEAAALWCQSVRILRRLTRVAPQENRALLIHCTRHYAKLLEELGRTSEAVDMHKSALSMKHRQFEHDPEAHRSELIPLVVDHAALLLRAGRLENACDQFENAIRLVRPTLRHTTHPSQQQNCLANLLSQHGESLVRLGRIEEACLAFKEAVSHKVALHESDRDSHAIDLARYYSSYAAALSHAPIYYQKSCDAYQQSIDLTRSLHHAYPDGSPLHLELIHLLWERHLILQRLGLVGDAGEVLDEAIVLQRRLAHANPSESGRQDDLQRFVTRRAELQALPLTRSAPARSTTTPLPPSEHIPLIPQRNPRRQSTR